MEPTIGEIRMFAGNFAPRDWALCEGQLLPINSYQSLFSVLGTIYGGDGRTTFALPDFRGRCPISPGTGPGLPSYSQGARVGADDYTLSPTNLPSHSHPVTSSAVSANAAPAQGDAASPNNRTWAASDANDADYAPLEPANTPTPLHPDAVAIDTTVGSTGSSTPVNNMQPSITVNYIICLFGLFPSRN